MKFPQSDPGLLVLGAFLFGAGMLVGQLNHEAWLEKIDRSTRTEIQAMAASTQTALQAVERAIKELPREPKSLRWWQRQPASLHESSDAVCS